MIRAPEAEVVGLFSGMPEVHSVQASAVSGDGEVAVTVEASHQTDIRPALARAVFEKGWDLLELRNIQVSLEDVFIDLITEETEEQAPSEEPERQEGLHDRIDCRISQRDGRFFVSPVAYCVIASFLFIFGFFFWANISFMSLVSLQAMNNPAIAERINLTDVVVRPLLQNMGIVMLFVIPCSRCAFFSKRRNRAQSNYSSRIQFPTRPSSW